MFYVVKHWIGNSTNVKYRNIYIYVYIYVYQMDCVCQHAHARMIVIIVEKSPNSSHMYDHGFMDTEAY